MAKNDGRYKLSAEGRRAHKRFCGDLHTIMEANVQDANDKFDAGDKKGAAEANRIVGAVYADARRYGCKWA